MTYQYIFLARLSGNISYDAFGSPYSRSGTFLNSESLDFGYLGKPYNAATGLYDYGFRDYSPGAARFTTLDPVRDGRNWYAYVLNDPVNFVDWDGRIQYPILALHTMQELGDEKKLNGVDILMKDEGCAVAAVANMLNVSLSFVNEQYVEN